MEGVRKRPWKEGGREGEEGKGPWSSWPGATLEKELFLLPLTKGERRGREGKREGEERGTRSFRFIHLQTSRWMIAGRKRSSELLR
jgi:hypothetical protein